MKKDYCKDFIIFLCVVGLVGCLYSIYQLNDRISKLEEYQVENSASRETDEIVRFLDSEPQIICVCASRSGLPARSAHKNAQNNKLHWL